MNPDERRRETVAGGPSTATGWERPLAPGDHIGSYEIVRYIDAGAMGVVYLARHTKLNVHRALKRLPPEYTKSEERVRRFEREARAASQLDHPNILTIHDFLESGGLHYIVSEYVDGETLRERMERARGEGERLSVDESLRIAEQIASALAAAHEAGIVHRDIKPENVMIRQRDGVVKVLDWGLAKLLERPAGGPADEFRTRDDLVVGTPNYMSPEQAYGPGVDGRSDLFSLGAVLYECLSGRLAFKGGGLPVLHQIANATPAPPSEHNQQVPPELDRVTLKLLAKNPEERHQSAAELLPELKSVRDALLRQEAVETRQYPRRPDTSPLRAITTLPGKLRRPRWALGAALLLLAASSVAYLALSGRRGTTVGGRALARYESGTLALRNGAYLLARINLEKAVGEEPGFAMAHVRLAETYLELDNREKARDSLDSFHSLVPDRSTLSQADRLYVEAVMASARRDHDGAVRSYSEIVKLNPTDPQAHLDLGRAYERKNDAASALASYQKTVELDPDYASALLRLGILYGRQQRQAESEDAFKRAAEIYSTQGNVEGRAEVHYQHGVILMSRKNIAPAREELQQALKLAEASGNEALAILARLQLGYAHIADGDPERAQKLAGEAVELARRSGMQVITMRGLIDLGNALYARGDLSAAEKYFEEALAHALASKDARIEARARFSLGSLRIQRGDAGRGDTERGLSDVEKAFQFFAAGSYRDESAAAQIVIGRALRDRGRYDDALRVFSERLGAARQAGVPAQVATAHDEIGKIYALREAYPEALANFDAAHKIYRELSDNLGVSFSLFNRADALWRLGRYNEAAELLAQLDELVSRPGGYRGLLGEIALMRAEILLSQNSLAAARRAVEDARVQADPEDDDAVMECDRLLCLISARAGKGEEAARFCAAASGRADRKGSAWHVARVQLASAEAQLSRGAAREALDLALRARSNFSATGRQESEWRALVVAALASRRAGDHDAAAGYAAQAQAALSALEQHRYKGGFGGYARRADVNSFRRRLDHLTHGG